MDREACITQLQDLQEHCRSMLQPEEADTDDVWRRDVEALDAAIEALRRQPHWTPCSECRPEQPGEYIVCIAGAAAATTLLWDGREWFEEYYNTTYCVDRWMPLPEIGRE